MFFQMLFSYVFFLLFRKREELELVTSQVFVASQGNYFFGDKTDYKNCFSKSL